MYVQMCSCCQVPSPSKPIASLIARALRTTCSATWVEAPSACRSWSSVRRFANAMSRGVARMPSIQDDEMDSDRRAVEYNTGNGLVLRRAPNACNPPVTSAACSMTRPLSPVVVPPKRSGW